MRKIFPATTLFLVSILLFFGCTHSQPGHGSPEDLDKLLSTIRPDTHWLNESIETLIAAIGQTTNSNERAKRVYRFQKTIQDYTENNELVLITDDMDLFSSFTSAYLNMELLQFEIQENTVINAEDLRWKVIHGSAPRTDVPTLEDLAHAPYAVWALRIIEAVSGEPDPILSAPNGRPVYHK